MAPRHTQGCGGAAYHATAHLSCATTKNWCVGFSFPPPAYAGIHPTLYLFGFRADALNSHSSLICLASIQGLVSSASIPFQDLPERLWAFLSWPSELRNRPGACGASGGFRGLWGPRFRGDLPVLGASEASGPPAGLRGPSGRLRGASGRLGGPRGRPLGDFGGLEPFFGSGRWVW